MLPKSQIFYFFVSFLITFVVGFFIWNIFISPSNSVLNQVLAEANKISSKFFPASLSSNQQVEIIVPVTNLEEDVAPEEILTVFNDAESQNHIVMTEQERQDLLDDIQERLDIIQQQVNELILEQNQNSEPPELDKTDEEKAPDDEKDADLVEVDLEVHEITACAGQINVNTASKEDLDKITGVGPAMAQKIIEARPFYSLDDLLKVSGIGPVSLQKIKDQGCVYIETGFAPPPAGGGGDGGGGGPAPAVYSKILISEVEILPTNSRFVELYNPNTYEVGLTDWYIQRKDSNDVSWGTFVAHANFAGKVIPAGSYFLISRELADSDILLNLTLSPNNFLAIKSPDGKISDEISFSTVDEGRSTGRKWDEVNQNYLDSGDNSADFETDTPTPKAQNIKYVAPEPVDTTAPSITLIGDSEITITVGDNYAEARATASDDTDGDITAKIITVNSVDTNTAGDYIITYNVSDAAGNNAIEVLRLVHVVAVTNPVDKTALESAIAFAIIKIQSDYTPDSWSAMQAVLTEAQTIDADLLTVQIDIDVASTNLNNAISALSLNVPLSATQLKIIGLPKNITMDTASGVITANSQNTAGSSTPVSVKTSITLSSDSLTGQFSTANATSCTGTFNDGLITLTMATGTGNKHFCYKDSTPGTYTIIVSATGLSADSQIITIGAPVE